MIFLLRQHSNKRANTEDCSSKWTDYYCTLPQSDPNSSATNERLILYLPRAVQRLRGHRMSELARVDFVVGIHLNAERKRNSVVERARN